MSRSVSFAWAVLLVCTACMSDPHTPLPDDANKVRRRSVLVDASQCLTKSGETKLCSEVATKDMQRVAELRGVIGAPSTAVELDLPQVPTLLPDNYGKLSAFWSRIPVGYGCSATLQGVFPDAAKDPADLKNYNFQALDKIIGAVRTAYRVPIWTAAYGLGDGQGAAGSSSCDYGDAGMKVNGSTVKEQLGTKMGTTDQDIAKWAKVVRQVTKYYNRTLPEQNKDDSSCKPPQGQAKGWRCSPSLFNIEFGRDPNGAGGFTDATKQVWLKSYKAFATELRAEFPYPGNDVLLIAPSVIVRGATDLTDTDPNSAKRSWLYDFIDYVVANKLKLSLLSFEVEAASPVEARTIVDAVRAYADKMGLKDEDGRPIRLFVTDLRLSAVPAPFQGATSGAAAQTEDSKANVGRFAAYLGAFYSATKTLWQGRVFGATMGRVVRFPSDDTSKLSLEEVAKTALDSDLLWFDHETEATGALKPTGWHTFWFNRDFLGSGGGQLDTCIPGKVCVDALADARKKGMVKVFHGPDALGESGTVKVKELDGIIALATRENCVSTDVDQLGEPIDCIPAGPPQDDFPAVREGRKRVIRVMVSDLNVEVPSENEVLMHHLRLEVRGLPADVKTVGLRWARMNGNVLSWTQFNFPEQGVLDVHNGQFHVERIIAVPSTHYFEFLY